MHIDTMLAHLGRDEADPSGALVPPIHPSVAFSRQDVDQPDGWSYSRLGNPTRAALEAAIATLHHARYCFAFGSGMAAVSAAAALLSPGELVLFPDDMYGSTYELFTRVLEPMKIVCQYHDLTDLDTVSHALSQAPALLWLESPTNPSLKIIDLEAVARLARAAGVLTLADNSFASPYLQRPLDLGIGLVMESTTKYLNGHDDLMGGALLTNDVTLAERLRQIQHLSGAVPSPADCWLLLRGMRTLSLRMDRQQSNAAAIATFLKKRPEVARVLYPGLEDHPGHAVAARQMDGFGAMLSFTLRDGPAAANAICEATQIFQLAGGLGGIASLISYPNSMSQAPQRGTPQAVDPSLVRLSVGIEHNEDLIADLEQALGALVS